MGFISLLADIATKISEFFSDRPLKDGAPCASGDIESALDATNWFQRDDAARQIVDELKDFQLAALPDATKLRLLEELRSGYMTDRERKAQQRLYESFASDPVFEKLDADRRQETIDGIRNMPETADAKADWSTMSESERIEYLNKVVEVQSDAYGVFRAPIETYQKEPNEDGSIENGYFSSSDQKLHLNTDPNASFNDYDEAVNTVTHENAHNYQNQMVRRSDEGVLKPGDPEYRQAQLFKANNDDNGYMKADQNYTAYRTQPVEAHAWQTGDTISAGVNAPDSAVAAPAPANPPLTGESTLP